MSEPAARVRKTTLSGSLVKPWPIRVPTNVGPPPMSAQGEQERPGGPAGRAVGVDVAGQRRGDAEALGGVVQREADHQQGGQGDLAARPRTARWPGPRRSCAARCRRRSAGPGGGPGSSRRRRAAGRPARPRARRPGRSCSGCGTARLGDPAHPALVRDQREQADAQTDHEQDAVAERGTQAAGARRARRPAPCRSAPRPPTARPRPGRAARRPPRRSAACAGSARAGGCRPIGRPRRIVPPAMRPSSSVGPSPMVSPGSRGADLSPKLGEGDLRSQRRGSDETHVTPCARPGVVHVRPRTARVLGLTCPAPPGGSP